MRIDKRQDFSHAPLLFCFDFGNRTTKFRATKVKMSSKTQSSFCETANEILQLALSLKESFDATESQKSIENSGVGAETRNLTFDAASETSRFSRKRKKKLKIPEPKKRKEDEIVSSNVPQSENVKQNLLENIKTVSESQATESEKTSDNLGVGAETQNLTFDAAIETTRFSCKLKKNLQIPEPKRRKEERNVSSNVTQSENAKQCLYENIKKLSEVDVETQNSTFEATNKTSRNYHQPKRKIEKLEVGVETQNSTFDATIKTSRSSCQVEIDKIRIMQVNAHGALTSTKLHKSEIILVNEFIQDLLEKHIQYYHHTLIINETKVRKVIAGDKYR